MAFGLVVGVLVAIGYSAIAVLVYLVGGEEAFEQNGVTFLSVVAAYWAGAMGSGLLLGLLRRITTSKRSAMLVGPFIAAPAVISLSITINGMPWTWQADAVATVIIVCVIFGVYGGYIFGPSHPQDRQV